MSKIDEVRKVMMQAMKDHDRTTKDASSELLTALKNAAIDKRADLTEEEENAIVKKEIRILEETIESAPADRTDIIEPAKKRIEIISKFAPADLSEAEINKLIDQVLSELGITAPSASDKGRIMKSLMPLVKGKADGKLVNNLVTARMK